MEDFDYSLEIEYERISIEGLQIILNILYSCSSECFTDIENLADEVIRRQSDCGYSIQNESNVPLKKLIISTFDSLKRISRYMEYQSLRIQIIYDLYQKYMHGIESPVASPVVSPKNYEEEKKQIKLPKIMKKVKNRNI